MMHDVMFADDVGRFANRPYGGSPTRRCADAAGHGAPCPYGGSPTRRYADAPGRFTNRPYGDTVPGSPVPRLSGSPFPTLSPSHPLTLLFFIAIAWIAPAIAQIPGTDLRTERALIEYGQRPAVSHNHTTADSLFFAGRDTSRHIGLDVVGAWRSGLVDYHDIWRDESHFLIAPYGFGRFHEDVTFKVRLHMENNKEELADPNRRYWGDEFSGMRGGVEIASMTLRKGPFEIRAGRDYHLPAVPEYEGLLFSNHQYAYDQLHWRYANEWVSFGAYYLDLNDYRAGDELTMRHLNGHYVRVNLPGNGWASMNEVVIYGGLNRQPNWFLLNPFVPYYIYSQNQRTFESNSILSWEVYYDWSRFYGHLELVLDDFQIDEEDPADLEPTEWGMNLTLGVRDVVVSGLNASINHTLVSNRTFNAPIKDYEKYLYRNLPIGHVAGNNFWELKSALTYVDPERATVRVMAIYREFGDEALYGPFNTDFLNFTVEEGYSEPFPFGRVRSQFGVTANAFVTLVRGLSLNGKLGWWGKQGGLPESTAFRLGAIWSW